MYKVIVLFRELRIVTSGAMGATGVYERLELDSPTLREALVDAESVTLITGTVSPSAPNLEWNVEVVPGLNRDMEAAAFVIAADVSVRWTYRVLGHVPDGINVDVSVLPGSPSTEAHDPCVTPRAEGGWWLFYTLHWNDSTGLPAPRNVERRGATFVAEAARLDAFHWDQYQTKPVFPADALSCDWSAPTAACDSAEDPSVELVRSAGAGTVAYLYVAGRIPEPNSVNHDTNWLVRLKSDLSVESEASVGPTCGGGEFKLSNPLATSGTDGAAMPWYGFQADPGTRTYIVAAEVTPSTAGGHGTTTDGVDGTRSGCSAVLVADRSYEGTGVKDPAIVRFGDCYVMAYTTDIPGSWGPGAGGKIP